VRAVGASDPGRHTVGVLMTKCCRWPLLVSSLLVMAAPVQAQIRASEAATISQTIDGTVLTLEYSRPRTRGRSPIYGDEVEWGEVWTPGANWATTLDVSNDVTINGHAVPKGKYSVWMQVEPGDWTVILDPRAKLFHTVHPSPDSSQIRFAVTPDSVSGPEVLTWSFPRTGPTGMTLQMAWAGRSVPLDVVVPPSHPLTLAASLAPRYTGTYEFRFAPRPEPPPGDSAPPPDAPDEGPPMPEASTWTVVYRDGMLLSDWDPPIFPEWSHMVLIKIGNDWFNPGAMVDDEVFDVANDLVVEFEVKNGTATGFVVRGEDDQVMGSAARIK
jgi:hypothetical protein